MKKLIIFVLCLGILFSCAHAFGGIGFTDSRGDRVFLPEKPKITAVLFSSFAEVWKLSGGDLAITVGEAADRGFAEESAILVDGGAGKSIDIERLIAAQPDFVICSMDIPAQSEAARLLKNTGIPTAEFRVETFEDYLKMLEIFCLINGQPEAYREYGTDVLQEIESIRLRKPESGGPSILFIRSGSGASSAKAKTADMHFAAQMLKELGALNIADSAPVLLDGLSMEEILVKDPDAIFISLMGNEEKAKDYMTGVLNSGAWRALSAVKNGRCYFLPKELFQFKPNSRWAEAYEMLYRCLYEES